jgi:mannuronan synthase
VPCDLYIHCNGFRAGIPTTARLLGDRGESRGGRFEFTEIETAEASILRRLIRSHLAGVHLTLEQLAAKEDAQTVRDRVKKTVRPPNPAPSLLRFGATLTAIAVLLLVVGAALYERLFVIEPDFAAVTAPEIRIYAPADGELAPHDFDAGDLVQRDQILVEVKDPEAEAQLVLAEATLNYTERMLENLRESLEAGGSATMVSGGGDDGAPVITELSPLELRARIKELESTYGFAKAKLRALQARSTAGTVYAPCDCVVHSIRSGDGGYWVQKGALIAQVISNGAEDVNVEALVHLGDISAIDPNERAEVIMPTTGETHAARVTSIQLESQNIERAGFPEWARQDMSHGSVILVMEDPLPAGLVGHPVEVRFIDTDSLGGEALAAVFGTLNDLLGSVFDPLDDTATATN